jgi:hypothetical protein
MSSRLIFYRKGLLLDEKEIVEFPGKLYQGTASVQLIHRSAFSAVVTGSV